MFGKKEKAAVWLRKSHLLGADEFICSACGGRAKRAHKICPHCGAKVTKIKKDSGWAEEAELLDIFLK